MTDDKRTSHRSYYYRNERKDICLGLASAMSELEGLMQAAEGRHEFPEFNFVGGIVCSIRGPTLLRGFRCRECDDAFSFYAFKALALFNSATQADAGSSNSVFLETRRR
ncbi:uncharacterized protein [Physcomitrium patens]|uniref:uncharacterized protein n=1 Tax=Physcomitrium patens TaxID=3218 RepID=UPI003CCCA3BC